MAAVAPAWRTVLGDSLGLVLVVWSIPVAIILIGTPIVLGVAVLIGIARWFLQA